MPILFTIGYEGLVQDQLIDMLVGAGVRRLIDVRAVAASRKPGFSKTLLGGSLLSRGIDYRHLVTLGTPKAGRDAARRGDAATMTRIYDAHLETTTAVAGLIEATALAVSATSCLLCFERDPACCHRHIVAARIAVSTGQRIAHL